MIEWDNILLFPIKNQKPITWSKFLLSNLSVFVSNSKYESLAKNKKKF